MKLFTKLIFAALVLAVMLPFTILKGKDGKPLMSFSDLKTPELGLPELPDAAGISGSLSSGTDSSTMDARPGTDVIYQWRDANGELNFSTEPPPAGVEYTAKGYDPNANLIQSVKVEKEKPATKAAVEPAAKKSADVDLDNPYSPERVGKLIDDAKNIQNLIDDRMKMQNELMNNR